MVYPFSTAFNNSGVHWVARMARSCRKCLHAHVISVSGLGSFSSTQVLHRGKIILPPRRYGKTCWRVARGASASTVQSAMPKCYPMSSTGLVRTVV